MTTKNIIREVSYKGHIITVFEDGFHQEFVIIDNDESKIMTNQSCMIALQMQRELLEASNLITK